jgi:hypothetical protein
MKPILLAAFLTAACAPVPQYGTGHCVHYENSTRAQEDVPNCLLRNRNTLINGLQPANPGNKS